MSDKLYVKENSAASKSKQDEVSQAYCNSMAAVSPEKSQSNSGIGVLDFNRQKSRQNDLFGHENLSDRFKLTYLTHSKTKNNRE